MTADEIKALLTKAYTDFKGNEQEQLSVYQQVVALCANDETLAGHKIAALYGICLIHFGHKDYELAIQVATEALNTKYSANDPNMHMDNVPHLYHVRGKCKFLLGKYPPASIKQDLETAKNMPESDWLHQHIDDILDELRRNELRRR